MRCGCSNASGWRNLRILRCFDCAGKLQQKDLNLWWRPRAGGCAHPTPTCAYPHSPILYKQEERERWRWWWTKGGALLLKCTFCLCKFKLYKFDPPPIRFYLFTLLRYELNEHRTRYQPRSHKFSWPQMKVWAVGVRETGVVVKGCHVAFSKQVESSRRGERCRMKKRGQLGRGWARWRGAGGVCDFPRYRMLLFLLCSTDRIKSQQANWPLPGADKVRRFMFSP